MKITKIAFLLSLCVYIFMHASAITVISPNGGESLQTGTPTEIKWTSSDIPGKVVILLYKKGIMQTVISEQTENTGAFKWNIPPGLPPGTDYRIRVRSITDLSVNDFSDGDFTILK